MDLYFEEQLWRPWLKQRPRFASEVIVELCDQARSCSHVSQQAVSAAVFEAIWARPPLDDQQPVAPTRRQGVPPWVLPALVRGLKGDFARLDDLLDALDFGGPVNNVAA